MPKETPKMAGTIMKINSRVKRTVREMPSRLTTRLSKGRSRNMMRGRGTGKASALQDPEAGGKRPPGAVSQFSC